MTSTLYALLVGLVAAERLAELVTARRNRAWSLARGGREYGRGHYPAMVALHTALLVGCAVEPWAADRPFLPPLGWSALALAVAAQGLRWWCIAALGPRWNTRVLVVPGLPLVARGPYRFLRHPNYVAVVVEGAALPLVHSAWVTAFGFTVLNAALLRVRIRCEEAALDGAPGDATPAHGLAAPAGGPAS
ncbi:MULTISPECIES: isoprenylcysteine carboxyl methyltransferase family protein [unclassified Streptomyces]|uniref:isoprenylcysteine carboxyl methyltransferase family protein n=1 Tax=unclassified Streptomyces TaxID=2593676 RepID=UPI001BE56CED|nr:MULTISPECIES: isoprenylcysteine carboxyl methyltransferase family protein [unclassified Streptomyces]MBT2406108.1 isoprenylcysteine carboxyl methyltransferase family protein [Streptomyces sp. ISL-21]MBT2457745.1 isoprenylcysteine carboxyl methyltransferase family protein [Streptomyces sp. ISL-86]MBT2609166.1 isoprenylcysteine carboxyl methyltransferase family protein [Streptomyces sp. ISL-87]